MGGPVDTTSSNSNNSSSSGGAAMALSPHSGSTKQQQSALGADAAITTNRVSSSDPHAQQHTVHQHHLHQTRDNAINSSAASGGSGHNNNGVDLWQALGKLSLSSESAAGLQGDVPAASGDSEHVTGDTPPPLNPLKSMFSHQRFADNNGPGLAHNAHQTSSFNETFALGDEQNAAIPGDAPAAEFGSSFVRRYMQMNAHDSHFPILVRRDSHPDLLSASSAALDVFGDTADQDTQAQAAGANALLMTSNDNAPAFRRQSSAASVLSAPLSSTANATIASNMDHFSTASNHTMSGSVLPSNTPDANQHVNHPASQQQAALLSSGNSWLSFGADAGTHATLDSASSSELLAQDNSAVGLTANSTPTASGAIATSASAASSERSAPTLSRSKSSDVGSDFQRAFSMMNQIPGDSFMPAGHDPFAMSALHTPFTPSENELGLTPFTNGFNSYASTAAPAASPSESLDVTGAGTPAMLAHSGLEDALSSAASTDPHAASAHLVCPFFLQGFCPRGDMCPFNHQLPRQSGMGVNDPSMLPMSAAFHAHMGMQQHGMAIAGQAGASGQHPADMANAMNGGARSSSELMAGGAQLPHSSSNGMTPTLGQAAATQQQQQQQQMYAAAAAAAAAASMSRPAMMQQMNPVMGAPYPFGAMPAYGAPFYPAYPFNPMYAAAAAAAAAANGGFPYGSAAFPRSPSAGNMNMAAGHNMPLSPGYPGFPMHGQMPAGNRHGTGAQNGSESARAGAVGGGMAKAGAKRQTGNNAHEQEANRYAGLVLEDMIDEIYNLCKDQHGCRFLQRKLEEQKRKNVNLIFVEVSPHVVELMTDPFGNYLCQKLIEFCTDEQRTAIVEAVSPELLTISLNMHGTRAVQKMIEFLSSPQQIRMVVAALKPNVVTLIKDLNGNHVIQKCLNRLLSVDNQFIYDAVAEYCVEVSTHRHGCCVLQRCIDHASDLQRVQLATEITKHAHTLVQDPFGNYVVQYVLDLNDQRFTDNMIRRFIGHVAALSIQKFSSNVIEKCIRMAHIDTRKYLISELLNRERLEKLLRDPYANYVVQTALDYSDPLQRAQLVECIRPLLPAVRNTPYGKRIQSKLQRDPPANGSITPPLGGDSGRSSAGSSVINGIESHMSRHGKSISDDSIGSNSAQLALSPGSILNNTNSNGVIGSRSLAPGTPYSGNDGSSNAAMAASLGFSFINNGGVGATPEPTTASPFTSGNTSPWWPTST